MIPLRGFLILSTILFSLGIYGVLARRSAVLILMSVKTFAFILFFMWMRGSMPRLRIDQMMSLCWQLLLPFAFLQIIINGLVLVYEWPDWTLGVMSGIAAVAAAYLTYRGARQAAVPASQRLHRVGSVL